MSSVSLLPALFLLGPTASGKTALALQLAQVMPIEIISVDSALVYRGMNIGTAKPTAAEMAVCPHHLIDVIEPTAVYNAAQFAQAAQGLIKQIQKRGRLPVLVGGTMLYVKALLEPLADIPATEPHTRAQVQQWAQDRVREQGEGAVYDYLRRIDPQTAARFLPSDTQRIHRALEVYQQTGQTMSAWLARTSSVAPLAFTPVLMALIPEPRAVLHERINARFEQMVAQGFLDEVRQLKNRGDLHPDLPSMRCVGYRQAWAHLAGEMDAAEFVAQGQAATRQLAKRQMTWLRGMTGVQVINPLIEQPSALETVLARLAELDTPLV